MEITYKIQTSFKALALKKATTWWLRKPQNNDKLLGTFNRYVTLKCGRGGGGNPFCYGVLLEGEGGSSDTVT